LTSADYQRIFRDAAELGVGMLFLAGGEPLLRMDVVGLAKSFPRLLFLVFTNGLHLPQLIAEFKNSPRAVIPIISIEGDAPDTDKRRGPGVAKSLEADLPLLTQHGMFWGLSITLTRFNTYVLEENFLWPWIAKGCRVFFFIDYVPKDSTTADWVLTPAEHTDMLGRLAKLERRLPALFISLPGDETLFSGCLAAGRGFIHLAADGRLEPCPFAPFSDRNVKDMPLEVALRSPLLATLRHAHPQLIEGHGGCTLWANRDHVASLLQQSSPTPGHE
jgi:MoaA/NifB/PqqE/SkfB family radical SAM enzyme